MYNITKTCEIKTLFLDIGGVLLTNGWGHESRKMAVERFGLNEDELEDKHERSFDTYELGKMTLNEYLDRVVFDEPRTFSREDFKTFMFDQSHALDGHIDFFKEVKKKYQFKMIAVSNEGRELNEHRIHHFKLDELFDAYICSCYVHLHKPDIDMLRMACDVSHTHPRNALYVDDSLMLIDVGRSFGLQTLHFRGLDPAKEYFHTINI